MQTAQPECGRVRFLQSLATDGRHGSHATRDGAGERIVEVAGQPALGGDAAERRPGAAAVIGGEHAGGKHGRGFPHAQPSEALKNCTRLSPGSSKPFVEGPTPASVASAQHHAARRMGVRIRLAAGDPAVFRVDETDALQPALHARRLQPPMLAAIGRVPNDAPVAHGPASLRIDERNVGQLRIFLHGTKIGRRFRSVRRLRHDRFGPDNAERKRRKQPPRRPLWLFLVSHCSAPSQESEDEFESLRAAFLAPRRRIAQEGAIRLAKLLWPADSNQRGGRDLGQCECRFRGTERTNDLRDERATIRPRVLSLSGKLRPNHETERPRLVMVARSWGGLPAARFRNPSRAAARFPAFATGVWPSARADGPLGVLRPNPAP